MTVSRTQNFFDGFLYSPERRINNSNGAGVSAAIATVTATVFTWPACGQRILAYE